MKILKNVPFPTTPEERRQEMIDILVRMEPGDCFIAKKGWTEYLIRKAAALADVEVKVRSVCVDAEDGGLSYYVPQVWRIK